jgi:GntR family transcriptional regulator, transcriptional repressor for pyruvate dehydrogenase complex
MNEAQMSATLPARSGLIDDVVEHLERRILSGSYATESKLPGESALAEEFSVSRPVIREVFARLRERGYLDTRNGVGTFVRHPPANSATQAVRRHLSTHLGVQYTVDQLYEARRSIESASAALAATRIGDTDLDRLEELLKEMIADRADGTHFATADVQFHLLVAEATGNPLMQFLLDPLLDAIIHGVYGSSAEQGARSTGIHGHAQVLERLRARDPEGARLAMEEHIDASRDYYPSDVLPQPHRSSER